MSTLIASLETIDKPLPSSPSFTPAIPLRTPLPLFDPSAPPQPGSKPPSSPISPTSPQLRRAKSNRLTSNFSENTTRTNLNGPKRSLSGSNSNLDSNSAGPSTPRHLFVAVRQGRNPGVYTEWREAESQLIDYPDPVFKTFSTRLAAEAFISGWDGAGRHSVPVCQVYSSNNNAKNSKSQNINLDISKQRHYDERNKQTTHNQGSCPKPLREHLAMNFPSSVPLSAPSKRPSYHSRLVSTVPDLPSLDEYSEMTNPYAAQSLRKSQVRISSPLRQQVDDVDQPKAAKAKRTYKIGAGGLLSPPSSPEDDTSVLDRARPTTKRGTEGGGLWASSVHRDFKPPLSPPTLPGSLSRQSSSSSLSRTSTGLWTNAKPNIPSPLAGQGEKNLADENAPKFSRSGIKKSGVVMPTAAPRTSSSSSIKTLLRTPSNASISSMSSTTSSMTSRSKTKSTRRQPSSSKLAQDRLASLAETTQSELGLQDGKLILDPIHLSPPRPAFMKRSTSNSSIGSSASGTSMSSMGSMTSASSDLTNTTTETCETPSAISDIQSNIEIVQINLEIPEQAHVRGRSGSDVESPATISCTKSEGDALSNKKGKKGGLFKRFTKALGLEKNSVPGEDKGRRGSL